MIRGTVHELQVSKSHTNRYIARQLVHTHTLQQLKLVVQKHCSVLNSYNVTTAFIKLRDLTNDDVAVAEDLKQALLQRLESTYISLSAPQVAQVLVTLVRCPGSSRPAWISQALREHQQGLYACDDEELCRLLWALVKLSLPAPSQEWLLQAANVGTDRLEGFDAQQLHLFGRSLYKLGYEPSSSWLSQYSTQARHWMQQDNTHQGLAGVTGMVYTLAAWQYSPSPAWLRDLYCYCERQWPNMKWWTLTLLMRALLLMKVQPPAGFLHSCSVCAVQCFHVSRPWADVEFLHALACFHHQVDPGIMTGLLQQMQPRLYVYDPSQLSKLLWALNHLQYMPSQEFVMILLEEFHKNSSSLSPRDLRSLLLALKQWQLLPTQEYMADILQCISRSWKDFDSQGIVDVVLSLKKLGVNVPVKWAVKLLEELVGRMASLQPHQLAVPLYAMRSLLSKQDMQALQRHGRLLENLSSAAAPTLIKYDVKHLKFLLLGLSHLKHRPENRFMDAALKCATELTDSQQSEDDLKELMQSLERLRSLA